MTEESKDFPIGRPWSEALPEGPCLYVVATPLGNLEDVTIRALRILSGVDLVLSEDTRKTAHLLRHYGIQTPTSSFRVHQIQTDIRKALQLLGEGRNLALVSDAGTPGVSDPGSHLVREIRLQLPNCPVLPIPGPSALTAGLSVSGWKANPSIFLGFLPRKPGKMRSLLEESSRHGVLVIYESVHRIKKSLEFIRQTLPELPILIGREITKLHEEWIYWPSHTPLPEFTEKGEFIILVGPEQNSKNLTDTE